jgi:hypothetical protein
MELAASNAPDRGGELSVGLSREEVAAAIGATPTVVARRNTEVEGFVLRRENSGINPPMVKAMLQAYPESENAYTYGPVCTAEEARGEDVRRTAKAAVDREGLPFIKANNQASLRTHRKMGKGEVGPLVFEGALLVIFAYEG